MDSARSQSEEPNSAIAGQANYTGGSPHVTRPVKLTMNLQQVPMIGMCGPVLCLFHMPSLCAEEQLYHFIII